PFQPAFQVTRPVATLCPVGSMVGADAIDHIHRSLKQHRACWVLDVELAGKMSEAVSAANGAAGGFERAAVWNQPRILIAGRSLSVERPSNPRIAALGQPGVTVVRRAVFNSASAFGSFVKLPQTAVSGWQGQYGIGLIFPNRRYRACSSSLNGRYAQN